MEVICLQDEAFYALVEQVFERLKEKYKEEDKWISTEEAMQKLRITSNTTLLKLRNEGMIRYSQLAEKKHVLYDLDSIYEYLEKNAKDTF